MNIDGRLGGPVNQRTGTMGAFASAMDRCGVTFDKTGLPLTRSDVELLKAVSGLDFSWPPKEGQLIPEGAFELGALREQQLRDRAPLKDFTVADIKLMTAEGLLPEETGRRAQEYLSSGMRVVASDNSPTAPRAAATSSSGATRTTYASNGQNNSLYL